MDNIKDDDYFIEKIKTDLKFVIDNTNDISYEEMIENPFLVDSIMFRIIQISESISKLSNGFTSKNSFIPWSSIKGMRNKIVHDYGMINTHVVYKTVKESMPEMYKQLQNINKTA